MTQFGNELSADLRWRDHSYAKAVGQARMGKRRFKDAKPTTRNVVPIAKFHRCDILKR